ncbi:hypothetical protein GCM10023310_69630 [Paenibacillus vulneris]|uniref:Uncharacterized protein n=1 Tax=Paenibacillus vulneris TaxID=1133364 RepID=A0ABW3UJA5_9BACL
MSYTAAERSSTFNCDDEMKLWSGSSCQPTVISRLRKAGIEAYKVDPDGMHWYKDIPFSQISFRSKSEKKRVMSDEHKFKLQEARRNKLNG